MNELWVYISTLVDVVVVCIALFLLIKDGSKPIRIWSWILLIIFLPFIGSIAYFSLGMNLRKKKIFNFKSEIDYDQFEKFIARYSAIAEEKVITRADITTKYIHLIRLLTRVNSSLISFNNKVHILHDGPNTFESIFEACEQAKEYIHLQYYIFIDGLLVDKFISLFKKKIEEGVEVRIIYDAVGSWDLSNKNIRRFEEIGVKIFAFMPVRFGRLARLNYRNHRKILIVDGLVGFTGG
ncbi:MAG: PLDc N-terminal domain-containing protein, partial [Flavobacteriaceae bacterium]